MPDLNERFERIDALRAALAEEERALHRDLKAYAHDKGLLVIPRPETVRAQLQS